MSDQDSTRVPFRDWIRSPQTIIALSALLLSVCGLFVAFYEASLIRRAQRASVWPYVVVGASSTRDEIRIWLRNVGVGPARIEAAALLHDGELEASWRDLVRDFMGEEGNRIPFNRSYVNGQVLPADSEQDDLFEMRRDRSPDAATAIWSGINSGEVDVRVCYCSVYDECWTSSLQEVFRRARGLEASSASRQVESCDEAPRSGI